MGEKAFVFTDGASLGNPGPSGIGMVFLLPNRKFALLEHVGIATNNQAEYTAVVRALEVLLGIGFKGEVFILSDSELLVKQLNGAYKVKSPSIRELFLRVLTLKGQVGHVRFVHIGREQNKIADKLAKIAADPNTWSREVKPAEWKGSSEPLNLWGKTE